jgi:hypothetical protein
VSGADSVGERAGFVAMLERPLSNGAMTVILESPDRFARDLMVQLAGHDMLKKGVTLIAASVPTFFIEARNFVCGSKAMALHDRQCRAWRRARLLEW